MPKPEELTVLVLVFPSDVTPRERNTWKKPLTRVEATTLDNIL